MSRDLSANMQTSVATQSGVEVTHFIVLTFSTGTSYLTTAPHDIAWNGHTWEGIGGAMGFEPIEESSDGKSGGTTIKLSGVDQSIISLILSAGSRGRPVEIYLAHLDTDAGTIVSDPVLIFEGFTNEGWTVREKRSDRGGGTVEISVRAVSELASLNRTNGIMTNTISHQKVHSGDTFFQHVPNLVGKPVVWNGTVRRGGHSPPADSGGLGWH